MIDIKDSKRILRKDGIKYNTVYKCRCDECGRDRGYLDKNSADQLCRKCISKKCHKNISSATKRKMALAKVGNKPWNAGRTNVYSDSTREKQRAAKLGVVPWNKNPNGTLLSDIKKIKNRFRHYLRKATFKQIINSDFKCYLQCDAVVLRDHIESQFRDGMTWDNYGEWQLDHCIPLSYFNLLDDLDLKIACHYKNVQPLWIKENSSKHNKKTVFILTGASGSGKSWVCDQLKKLYDVSDSDNKVSDPTYGYRPIYAITVGVSTFIKNHPHINFKLIVIQESEEIIKQRLINRGGKITNTLQKRIKRMSQLAKNAVFSGTSQEVLDYLNNKAYF